VSPYRTPLPSVEELQPARTTPTEESRPEPRILELLKKYYPVQYEFWMRRIK
jgi:hypothetical protein